MPLLPTRRLFVFPPPGLVWGQMLKVTKGGDTDGHPSCVPSVSLCTSVSKCAMRPTWNLDSPPFEQGTMPNYHRVPD